MNKSFHEWLRGCLPATTAQVCTDLSIGHRSLPEAYKDFPRKPNEVEAALKTLAVKGLVVNDGKLWRWVARREPQKGLF